MIGVKVRTVYIARSVSVALQNRIPDPNPIDAATASNIRTQSGTATATAEETREESKVDVDRSIPCPIHVCIHQPSSMDRRTDACN